MVRVTGHSRSRWRHGPETKNKEKIKSKPSSPEETLQAKVRESSTELVSKVDKRLRGIMQKLVVVLFDRRW